ncbi:hypothetical protein DBP21_34430 [Streptomyces sp. CS147]|nr:hypothetical protein DBP21_34430 [Streptomyces sp. CS147]
MVALIGWAAVAEVMEHAPLDGSEAVGTQRRFQGRSAGLAVPLRSYACVPARWTAVSGDMQSAHGSVPSRAVVSSAPALAISAGSAARPT